MTGSKILVVEDEEDIQELIQYNLEKEGFEVVPAINGELALKIIKEDKPDLVLLDLMLPGIDGLELCGYLKKDETTRKIPIIMATAKGEESDIVKGLEMGAEDYITKPFSTKILCARVKAVLRRSQETRPDDSDIIKINDLEIHPGRHEVFVERNPIDLTASEFNVLHLLARKPGWVYTRYQIVENIRGENYPVTDRSIDVLIVSLRKKLGTYGKYISTVRGIGYRFKD